MSNEQLMEMSDKIMESLYKALMDGKIITVQGMCDAMEAIKDYQDIHHSKYAEISAANAIDYVS